MDYNIEELARQLKAARLRKRLSQRALAEKVGMPQSHISKIENGRIDIRISSLMEFARVLDLEPMLIPRKLVPAVQSMIRGVGHAQRADTSRASESPAPAYRLDEDQGQGDG